MAREALRIAKEMAREPGIRHRGTRTVVYADERREERPVTWVTIEIGNLATQTEAIFTPAGRRGEAPPGPHSGPEWPRRPD